MAQVLRLEHAYSEYEKLGTKLNDAFENCNTDEVRAGKSEDMVAASGYRTDHVQQGARDDPAPRQLNNEVVGDYGFGLRWIFKSC